VAVAVFRRGPRGLQDENLLGWLLVDDKVGDQRELATTNTNELFFTNKYENDTRTDLTRRKLADNTYEMNPGSSLQFFYFHCPFYFFLPHRTIYPYRILSPPIPDTRIYKYTNIQFNPVPYITTTLTSIYARCLYHFGLASLILFYSSFEPTTGGGKGFDQLYICIMYLIAVVDM
jgi:hypothetical protein